MGNSRVHEAFPVITSPPIIRGMTSNHAAPDWTIAHRVVKKEASRLRLTTDQLAALARMDRSTIHRMSKGAQLSEESLDRIEGALGLPRDFLTYVANHDLAAIGKTDAPPDLVTWLTTQYATNAKARRV